MRHLLYSHDSYGLGHFRRSLLIAEALVAADPSNEVLLVTGSARAHSFHIGERIDLVRIPAATKDENGSYRSRSLALDLHSLVDIRRALIGAALDQYRPDIVLVDHAPLGLSGELGPLLARKHPSTRWILGLRDIIDQAPAVETQWRESGSWDAIANYDKVVVYGDEQLISTATELDIASRLDVEVTHVGYLGRSTLRNTTPKPSDNVLVCAGGGGDGFSLVSTYVDYVEQHRPRHRSTVITGPLMSTRRVESLTSRADRLGIRITEFTDNIEYLLANAGAVVSMAGYNTVVEEMACGVSSMLVPRDFPRAEQSLRAARVAPHGNFVVVPQQRLTVGAIASFIGNNLGSARITATLDLDGLDRVAPALANNSNAEVTSYA